MSIDALNSGSVNTAGLDGSDKAGAGRPVSPFSHSQLGSGKVIFNPSLFVDASDIQDALEGGANLKKLMATSKKTEDAGDDFLETLHKKLQALKKVQETGQSQLDPEQLGALLKQLQNLHENGELNESAIKRTLEGMSGQDQYEALGLIIETLRESNSETMANTLANTPVIDHNGQPVTFSEKRNGLQRSMSHVADFRTLAEAVSYIFEEMKTSDGFYKTVLDGIEWLRSGLVIEMAMMKGSGSASSPTDVGKPTAQAAAILYLSGNTGGALALIHRMSDSNELLLLQEKIKQVPLNTPHQATVLTTIEERLNQLQREKDKAPSGRSARKG